MNYAITVNVRFDPESLCEHEFAEYQFGLAKLAHMEECGKCGAWRSAIVPEVGGINRKPASNFWRSSASGV